jgi:ADP-ribose pyrophosphatase
MGPSRWLYRGRTVDLRVDPVRVGQVESLREVVERVPAVGIIAETSAQQIVMISQFRWAVNTLLCELPAGKVDSGETPEAAAQRELREETGYVAENWQRILAFYPSPGYTNEVVYLYYASHLHLRHTQMDPDEEIATELWSKEQILDFVHSSEPVNGIAYAGLQWWLSRSNP